MKTRHCRDPTKQVSLSPSPSPNTYKTAVFSTITGQTGSAILVTDKDDTQQLKLWLKVVEKLPNNRDERAFPEFDGSPLTHLERKIDRAARSLGHDLPHSTAFRKELEIRNKRLEGPKREAVSRALSHSIGTAALYYQAPSQSDSIATYRAIQTLIEGREGRSPEGEEGRRSTTPPRHPVEKGKGRAARQDSPKERRPRIPSETPSPSPQPRKERVESPPQPRSQGRASRQDSPIGRTPRTSSPKPSPNPPPRKRKARSPPQPRSQSPPQPRSQSPPQPRSQSPPQRSSGEQSRATPKRRKFTEEETENVKVFFARHITDNNQPALGECREFLEIYKMDRSAKNVQDKVRNLAGR